GVSLARSRSAPSLPAEPPVAAEPISAPPPAPAQVSGGAAAAGEGEWVLPIAGEVLGGGPLRPVAIPYPPVEQPLPAPASPLPPGIEEIPGPELRQAAGGAPGEGPAPWDPPIAYEFYGVKPPTAEIPPPHRPLPPGIEEIPPWELRQVAGGVPKAAEDLGGDAPKLGQDVVPPAGAPGLTEVPVNAAAANGPLPNYYDQFTEVWRREQTPRPGEKPEPVSAAGGFSHPDYKASSYDAWLAMNPRQGGKSQTDWKVHLSVDPQDVPRAWNIVADELQNRLGQRAKVMNPDSISTHAGPGPQQGKQIVIYDAARGFPAQDWQSLLDAIEKRFSETGIRPGLPVNYDRPVPGSQYSFYRNDGRSQTYIPARELADLPPDQQYNPLGVSDPLENVRVGPAAASSAEPRPMTGPDKSSADILAHAAWQPAKTEDGKIIRVAVREMKPQEIAAIKEALTKKGIPFVDHPSETLGPTIRVWGDGVAKLQAVIDEAKGRRSSRVE
ncbi:MAG TPA: hypothetical protein VEU47_00480, partial [Candidatus Cybelea sp.]|nr:hypothetical protein [Candidatus Cybelea sp.]